MSIRLDRWFCNLFLFLSLYDGPVQGLVLRIVFLFSTLGFFFTPIFIVILLFVRLKVFVCCIFL